MSTRTLAITNQKGGVGKTTTVVNVAACAAEMGRKVLIADLDPQNANATRWVTTETPALSMIEVLAEEVTVAEAVVASTVEGVDILGATDELSSVEPLTGLRRGTEPILARALSAVSGYDLVLIDCPPALGLLTVSGLVAADEVVIPVTLDALAMVGLAQLLDSVDKASVELNPTLRVGAVIPCRVAPRQAIAQEVLAVLVEHFGERVTPSVRRSVRLEEIASHHEALTTYAPLESVTQDYRAVTAALLTEGEK